MAYYLTGDAAKAIETEEKAISLLPPKSTAVSDGGSGMKGQGGSGVKKDATSQLRKSLEESLARFRRTAASQPSPPQHAASQQTTQPAIGQNQSSVTTDPANQQDIASE